MLNLSLTVIARAGERAQWEIPLDDLLWEGSGITLLEPVFVEVEGRPIGEGGVLVRGRVRTRVQLDCRRCLVEVHHTVDEPLELLFEDLAGEEAEELSGEVFPLPKGDELHLGDAVREQLLLHVSPYVVCDEACQGLCPQCGANRNEAPCECVPAAEGNVWDALKKLKFE